MPLTRNHLACIAMSCLAFAAPIRAESFASSASSAGSASSGSVSDSIEGSSDASSGDDRVAEGEYRVIDVAEPAERPGMLRLELHATAADTRTRRFVLYVPRQALAQRGLARGDVISARHRPYGLEFARANTREPFFLALADDTHRELASNPVGL
jgi:hypothetical protein